MQLGVTSLGFSKPHAPTNYFVYKPFPGRLFRWELSQYLDQALYPSVLANPASSVPKHRACNANFEMTITRAT